jgi:hypothetical protein
VKNFVGGKSSTFAICFINVANVAGAVVTGCASFTDTVFAVYSREVECRCPSFSSITGVALDFPIVFFFKVISLMSLWLIDLTGCISTLPFFVRSPLFRSVVGSRWTRRPA